MRKVGEVGMKGSCDSMPHLANESFLTKEQQDKLKGIFDDFVHVIRCKDCKHLQSPADGVRFCKHIKNFVDADWFCADGERRETE